LTIYRRVVSGFSLFRITVHKLAAVLIKYQGKILQWVFANYTVEQTQQVTDLINLIIAVDAFLWTGDED
jgi:hypothetical protein